MAALEDLTKGAVVRGVRADGPVTVVQAEWHRSGALTLTYTDAAGHVAQELLYRDKESALTIEQQGRAWSLDGSPVPEAGPPVRPVPGGAVGQPRPAAAPDRRGVRRDVGPPAVALPAGRRPRRRQDDHGRPADQGADARSLGLRQRGPVPRRRPGSRVDQGQDELADRFNVAFEILTRDMIEAPGRTTRSPSGRCSSPASTTRPATRSSKPRPPPAPPGVVARGDLPVDQPPPKASRDPPGRAAQRPTATTCSTCSFMQRADRPGPPRARYSRQRE